MDTLLLLHFDLFVFYVLNYYMVFDTDFSSSSVHVVTVFGLRRVSAKLDSNCRKSFFFIHFLTMNYIFFCSNKNNKQFVNFLLDFNLIACLVTCKGVQIVIFVRLYRVAVIAVLQLTALHANDSVDRKRVLMRNQYFTNQFIVAPNLTFHFLRVYMFCSCP